MPTVERAISFLSDGRRIAGSLHLPSNFDPQGKYPAIVAVGPGSSTKEQAGGLYSHKLAERGFVTVAFDPSFQGESEGEPRDLESPSAKVEDIRSAVDFLVTQPFIDEDAIGLLGICAGGGYAINAALIERRFKAVGTVVANDIGSSFRRAADRADAVEQTLAEVARLRTAQARGAEPTWVPWLPSREQAEDLDIDDPSLMNAIDYYATPRGACANRSNHRLATSDALLIGFDAFHLAGELLVQPLQVIVGGKLGKTFSYEAGKKLWEMARNRKDFVVVEGADHYDMYDIPEYVDQAISSLFALYDEHLRSAPKHG